MRGRTSIKHAIGIAVIGIAVGACTSNSTDTTRASAGASATLSPPAGQIVFDQVPNGAEDPESAFIVNADGTNPHRLRLPVPGLLKNPAPSPDGTLLALGTSRGPAIAAVDGSGFKLLHPTMNGLQSCVWSPDARRLLCDLTDRGNLDGLYSVRASDGRGLVRLTTSPYHDLASCGGGGGDLPEDYSPDGTQFVFIRQRCSLHESRALYVENMDGSGLHRITPYGPNDGAAWSPDGREILFSHDCRLYTIAPDGSDMTEIPEDACAFAADWSPDGRWIVFEFNQPEGSPDLVVASADGTNVTRITHTPDEKEILTRWVASSPP